jgi:16S rRNA (cytidine1402-2'-O)-methyltransferase
MADNSGIELIVMRAMQDSDSGDFQVSAVPSLYVVATPIGNLGDMTPRARQVLMSVDRIAAEDTRNTGRLLEKLGIRKPLMAHHAHNEKQSAEGILACLERGESIALVSDAGTPAVSDPGAVVVRRVAQAGFNVVPLPGASSVLAVVAASGLVDGAFTFRGFLPAKGRDRLDGLRRFLDCAEPQILFEAPHRIRQLMDELLTLNLGERAICAGRELTKQFETFYRGNTAEVAAQVAGDVNADRGEWALVIEGKPIVAQTESEMQADTSLDAWILALLNELPSKSVVKLVTQVTSLPKNQVYARVLELKDDALTAGDTAVDE